VSSSDVHVDVRLQIEPQEKFQNTAAQRKTYDEKRRDAKPASNLKLDTDLNG
jgi:hypothetical protein